MGFQTHYMYSQTVWGPWAPQQVPPHLCGQKRWKYYEEIPYRFICWWCFVWNFLLWTMWGFPRSAVVKNLPTNAGDTRDLSLIPGSGRSPGVGNGNPFQYSCQHPIDRGAWQATVHGVSKSQTWLSTHTHRISRVKTLDEQMAERYNFEVISGQSRTDGGCEKWWQVSKWVNIKIRVFYLYFFKYQMIL